MILVSDTETSGKPKTSRLAQIAMRLEDDQRRVVGQYSAFIRPDGWVMPDDTAAFHGLTQERLLKYGVNLAAALTIFNKMCEMADVLVFHNEGYDTAILRNSANIIGFQLAMPHKIYCTMKNSTDLVKAPLTDKQINAGFTGFKQPTLQEAHQFFTGQPFDGAHDAMNDVGACSKVYWGIQDRHKNTIAA